MRLLRSFFVVGLVTLATLVPAMPAQAGGWALTLIDPMNETITVQPATKYSITYWVLQHGTHPYEGELGMTGLSFSNTNGKVVTFEGIAMAEPAHYRVEVQLPAAGLWRITALQGVFAPHEVGMLLVPGRVATYPTPIDPAVHGAQWGAVRPPGFCADTRVTEATSDRAPAVGPPAAGKSQTKRGATRSMLIAVALAGSAIAIAAVVLLLWGRRAARRPKVG